MKLHDEWKSILRKAWSIRLMVVASVLSGMEVALPHLDGIIPAGWFALASFLVTVGAMIARLLVQHDQSE